MTNIAGFTPSYDSNGNVLNDGLHSYTWNADGLPVTIDSVNLTYDALGRMAEQNRSGAYTQFLYSPTGFKMSIMNGQSSQKTFVPLPAGDMAVYTTTLTYIHADWLGSPRLGSTPSRTMYFDVAYAPFGETYAASGTTDPAFTSQRQDTVTGLYDFPAREYSIQGRWPSPDPAGLLVADPSNPQSWNRYAYVLNNPLSLIDPLGLDCVDVVNPDGSISTTCTVNGGDGGGPIPPDTCVPIVTDGVEVGTSCNNDNGGSSGGCRLKTRSCDAGGGGGGGGGSPSPTWAAIKTFFTLPSTGPGSCFAVFQDAVNGPGTTVRSAGQNVTKYGVPIANGLAAGAMSTAIDLNNMLRARQLDPFLGPAVAAGATTIAAGLNYVAAGVARLLPYAPYAVLGTADAILFTGVIKEGIAAAKGQCKP